MKIGISQINTTVGDLTGNATLIFNAYKELVAQGADLVITPELALTGYPPQDLLFSEHFIDKNLKSLSSLEKRIGTVPLLVGFVDKNKNKKGKPLYNAAALLQSGAPALVAHKRLLPTYDVFDEARYFEPGNQSTCFSYLGRTWGITICEDLWTPEYLPSDLYSVDPVQELVDQGAQIILNLSASPFQLGKPAQRLAMLQAQAERFQRPIVYCNSVGGNDQLIFDGHSLVINAQGHTYAFFQGYQEEKNVIDLSLVPHGAVETKGALEDPRREDPMQELHDALVLGIRDYLRKCGLEHALLGLSGGIDSAVVAALAAAALGAQRVTGVLMPGPYSSQGSIDDAITLANNLRIPHLTLPITRLFEETKMSLREPFEHLKEDLIRIFHTDRGEEAAKADGARRAMTSDDGCVYTHCPRKTSRSTQHPSGFPASAGDRDETFGLTRIFHTDRGEEGAKADGARRAMTSGDGCVYTHCPRKTSRSTQHPSGFPASVGDRDETSGLTEENLQARLRGVTLMALSNKLGGLLLTTGNKSELAVGYCTLYGDMCGGLAVIADVPKTVVYQLAHWINRKEEIIPWNSIQKAPSAELRPNQKDEDSLPPYEVLDKILELFLEENQSVTQIMNQGFAEKTVLWVIHQIYRNEYKRQQSAPGLKVTSKAFGLGRRFPIAHGYIEK
ncbi:MAG: NAD(+) synthase [Chthoniobacterales bacterium]|nr:NAD(+) synthase [Chthoniobacterales bacterium]